MLFSLKDCQMNVLAIIIDKGKYLLLTLIFTCEPDDEEINLQNVEIIDLPAFLMTQ